MKLETIKQKIEDYTNIKIDTRTRKREYVEIRYMYYFFCLKYGSGYVNDTKIAKTTIFDRCTVLYGTKEFKNILRFNENLQKIYNELDQYFKQKDNTNLIEDYTNIDMDKEYLLRELKNKTMLISKLRNKNNKLLDRLNKKSYI